jgi:hypothetical protein
MILAVVWLGADEGFDRGYAQAVDHTTKRDLARMSQVLHGFVPHFL